jgi:hypothetical protein
LIYLPSANLVYVAVPKTAGTSTFHALRAFADPGSVYDTNDVAAMHRPASYAKRMFPGADVVCVMREPIDWMFSKYRYLSGDSFAWDSVYTTRHQTFSRFVTRYLQGEKPWPEPFRMQAEYAQGADMIFQYEQMEHFVGFLSQRLEATVKMPRVNVSPARNFDLLPHLEHEIRQALNPDFLLWRDAFRA